MHRLQTLGVEEEVTVGLHWGLAPKHFLPVTDSIFEVGGRIPPGTSSSEREKSQVTQLPWNVPGIIMGTWKVFMAKVDGGGDEVPAPAVGGRPRRAVLPFAVLQRLQTGQK